MLIKGWHNSHPADYWAALTKGYNWSKEDEIPTAQFNTVLWNGLMGGKPYPTVRNGIDYSKRGPRHDLRRPRHRHGDEG